MSDQEECGELGSIIEDCRTALGVLRKKEPEPASDTTMMRSAFSKVRPDEHNQDAVMDYYELSRQSLDDVIHLTEYEDSKATRTLTVNAFIGAAAGAFYSLTPIESAAAPSSQDPFLAWFKFTEFFLFSVYALFVAVGAIITFHAIRLRFKLPAAPTPDPSEKRPRSFVFYEYISSVTPEVWTRAFVTNRDGDSISSKELRLEYASHFVCETYLVAQKIRDKVSLLAPGQRFLFRGLIVLLFALITHTVGFAAITFGWAGVLVPVVIGGWLASQVLEKK